jgi:hypothetical protein
VVNGVDKDGVQTQDPNKFDMGHPTVKRDNWKWSIYASREISRGLRLYGQFANDHLRVPAFDLKPSWTQITDRNGKDWYYLIRLELGI